LLAIKNYTDHAANERTFLAWLRTGLAVLAFGVVVEKLNLFLAAVAEKTLTPASTHGVDFLRPFRHYEGLAPGLLGFAIIVFGVIRFVITAREIDRIGVSVTPVLRTELVLTGALALLAAVFCLSLALP
jgi:putative membrane protein